LSNRNEKIGDNLGYYIHNKKKIIKEFNSIANLAKEIVTAKYSTFNVEDITKQAYTELEDLLIKLPYVGGKKSPFTPLMIQSAMTAALCKACKSLPLSPYQIGELIYEIAETSAQSISSFKKFFYRKALFSKKMKNNWKYWMKESQKGNYLENWVGVFIEGDGEPFDYGFNFTECGWLKLVEKEGITDFAPYVCLCDYARMRAIGIGFRRTKNLAAGAELCDFRFFKNYDTPKGWPPEDLEESKDFYVKLNKNFHD